MKLIVLAALIAATPIHSDEASSFAEIEAQIDLSLAAQEMRLTEFLAELVEIKAAIQRVHIGFTDRDVEAVSASLAPGFFWLTNTGGIYRPEYVSGGAVDLREFLTTHERINPAIYDTELVFTSSHPNDGNVTVTTTATKADKGQVLRTDWICTETEGTWKVAGVITEKTASPFPDIIKARFSAAANRTFRWDDTHRPFY